MDRSLNRRRLLAAGAAGAAATAVAVVPATPAAAAFPEDLEGRLLPYNDGDLLLAVAESTASHTVPTPSVATYDTGYVDGGVLRRATSLRIPWYYTQTAAPVDSAIGTAVNVDWHATLNDQNYFGPIAQTGWFGPRGVFHLEGELQYQRNMGQFNITPIGFGYQLIVSNAGSGTRTITPGWGFMNQPWFVAKGGNDVILRYNDTARGMAGFVDNQLFTAEEGSAIDGTTHGYEALSFASRNFVTPGVHLSGVVGFDMADINQPVVGMPGEGPAAGEIDYTIGLRVAHLGKGDSFGIGVENASRTVLPPQTAALDSAGDTIRTDATWVVVENSTSGALTLTSVPTLPDGREGQVLTLVNSGAQPVTIQGESTLAGSNSAQRLTLLAGDVVDLVFHEDLWRLRSRAVSWAHVESYPGVTAFGLPAPKPGVTSYQSTHPSGGSTGIDIMTPAGETNPAASIRMFRHGESAARTVIAAGILGFSDGTDALGGTYLARTSPGVLSVGNFAGALQTVQADLLHGGQRRDIGTVTSTGYTVVEDDRRRTVVRNNASASTMTWPSDSAAPKLSIGVEIPICNLGAGAITHQSGAGATVHSAGTQAQGSRRVATKIAANTWFIG
jgi:hypothetical protein